MAKRTFVVCSRMDPERLKQYLQQTEQNTAQGNRHVAEQHALVARLEQQGHDTASARALLALLEESLRLHMAERDRLLRELDELFPREAT
jgi:regulator of protease activity HflC (stomatin/prohibitin superfamily)